MSLETLHMLSAVLTSAGVVLALATTYIVWVDKRHVRARGTPQEYAFARQVFGGKLILLAIQAMLLYVRVNSMRGTVPGGDFDRDVQFHGVAVVTMISMLVTARSVFYLTSRKRILSYH